MKKTIIFCIVIFCIILSSTTTRADPNWEISIPKWFLTGSFNYTLFYPYSSQVVSRVILPQDQSMTILNAKYTLVNQKDFIKLKFGRTGTESKGRGSDSDWRFEGSDILTDYGELDAYGTQTIVAIDFGTIIIKNDAHQSSIFMGWVRQETTNELKNIVYHLSDGVDLGDQPQPDNGSSLAGELRGLSLGINDERIIRANLKFTTELSLLFLRTKADGHWANYTPAWNWENTGRTVGYRVDIGLKYAFNNNIQAGIGYCYNYAKATECREILNGTLLSQLVDLQYEQEGLHAGLIVLF